MDGVRAATPQQLQIPPLRFAAVRDDKGTAVTFRKDGDLDGRSWRAATP